MRDARAAVVTVSDGVARGVRDDTSGDAAEALLRDVGFEVATRVVVPDERAEIASTLRALSGDHALVVTTGGTGFGPRDVTPEATREVLDREAPGLPELMRSAGLSSTPMAALSRALAGARGATLILNLPGSERGVRESLGAVATVLGHAVELLGGATGAHPTGHGAEVVPGATPVPDIAPTPVPDIASTPAPDTAPTPAPSAADTDTPAPDEPHVVATAVRLHGSPPCRVGNRAVVVPGGPLHGTLGCAEFDAAAVDAAADVLATGEPETRTFQHDLGDVEVYLEPRRPAPRAFVVSATDVARALASHVRTLGYRPVLVEPRAERVAPADSSRFDAVVGGAAIDPGPDDVAVLTDHDAPGVADTLAVLLRSPVGFVGVMGSRRHVGPYVEALRSLGFSDEDLGRIRSPVGLDLGGRTSDEIALSIAAGLVAAAHGRPGGWLDR